MSKSAFRISMTWADGRTVAALADTLTKRMHYLNETATQAVHATAVNALKTLRTLTRVAKASGIKVEVLDRSDLKFSYYYLTAAATGSKAAAKMCLRNLGGARLSDGEAKIIYADCHGKKTREIKVFEFDDVREEGTRKYLIAASTRGVAKKTAQNIVARRVLRYSGLARRAISALMIKTNNKGPSDATSFRVAAVANRTTRVRRAVSGNDKGGQFVLHLYDDLNYAARALKGGQAAVDIALKKAANMSIGRIKQKCADLLMPGEIKTPFPEVARRS